jgi:hypothetical protein
MDLHDEMTGAVGGTLPDGKLKRDFWGQTYFEPYPYPRYVPPPEGPSDVTTSAVEGASSGEQSDKSPQPLPSAGLPQ